MAIYDFFVSRNGAVSNTANYIGHAGRLFYDSDTGVIKLSDGITPGGLSVPYTIATAQTIGGIKAGPGANVSVDGTLTIDTSGLPLSFGDFTANVNVFTLVNSDQNMILATRGNAEIQLVGNIGFYKPNGLPPNVNNRYFRATNDGQIRIYVPAQDPAMGAVEIIGSTSGNIQSSINTGTMLHVTGQNNLVSRIYNDSINNYSVWVGRRYNGTATSPTPVLAGDILSRFGATTYHSGGTFTPLGVGRFSFYALENHTATAQGAAVELGLMANGANVLTTVATWTVADGMIGNVVGNIRGNTASFTGNVTVNGNLIGNAVTTTATIGTGNITTLNVSSNATVSGRMAATTVSGKLIRAVRNAGTIADGGTLTVNFSTDAVVYCTWANGMTLAYSNFTAGSVIKVMCTKDAGSGTDILSLGGVTASQVSSGTTSVTGTAGTTTFVELICTGTTIGSVFVKL